MWYYPLPNYSHRILYKDFAQNITSAWYTSQPDIFPNKFTGFHAAVDLEVLPADSQPISVRAITDGKILYSGPVSGYGGLILERLSTQSFTALYGHVRTDYVKVGDTVTAGQEIATLGTAYSTQTAGERSHLHFGIYNGTDLYFRGYESTLSAIKSKWQNPTEFLSSRSAVDPAITSIVPTPSSPPVNQTIKNSSYWSKILQFFRNLFKIT